MKKSAMRVLLLAMALCGAQVLAQGAKDIRAPLTGGMILIKDLSKEKGPTSVELTQTLEAAVQNPGFKFKIIVTKGSSIVAEVEKQVVARKLQDRIQLVEK